MFQADSDFYHQYTAAATTVVEDVTTTWQPISEQVIQGGELVFHTREAEGDEVTQEEGGEVVAQVDPLPEGGDEAVTEGQGEEMECGICSDVALKNKMQSSQDLTGV